MLAAIGLTSDVSVDSDADGIRWRRMRGSFLAFGTPLTKRHTRHPLKQTQASFFSGLNLCFMISCVHNFSRCKWISVFILDPRRPRQAARE